MTWVLHISNFFLSFICWRVGTRISGNLGWQKIRPGIKVNNKIIQQKRDEEITGSLIKYKNGREKKSSNKTKIKKILVITTTNCGCYYKRSKNYQVITLHCVIYFHIFKQLKQAQISNGWRRKRISHISEHQYSVKNRRKTKTTKL